MKKIYNAFIEGLAIGYLIVFATMIVIVTVLIAIETFNK